MPDDRPLLTFDIDGVLCRPPFGLNPGSNRNKSRTAVPRFNPLWPFERWRYHFRQPMPGARAGFAELAGRYRCVAVSARGGAAREHTRRWLERNFRGLDEIQLRPAPRETSAQFKVRTLTALSPIAHFEDDPHTAEWLAELLPAVFLVDWPRNRWLEAPNIHRISHLGEAVPVLAEGQRLQG